MLLIHGSLSLLWGHPMSYLICSFDRAPSVDKDRVLVSGWVIRYSARYLANFKIAVSASAEVLALCDGQKLPPGRCVYAMMWRRGFSAGGIFCEGYPLKSSNFWAFEFWGVFCLLFHVSCLRKMSPQQNQRRWLIIVANTSPYCSTHRTYQLFVVGAQMRHGASPKGLKWCALEPLLPSSAQPQRQPNQKGSSSPAQPSACTICFKDGLLYLLMRGIAQDTAHTLI